MIKLTNIQIKSCLNVHYVFKYIIIHDLNSYFIIYNNFKYYLLNMFFIILYTQISNFIDRQLIYHIIDLKQIHIFYWDVWNKCI